MRLLRKPGFGAAAEDLGQAYGHQKWSFEQEFVALLRKAVVEYDPQYVFG